MNARRRSSTLLAALSAMMLLGMFVAQFATAADGEGLAGRTTDKTITFFCFGVILFFPLLVISLSLIQGKLEKRKERRRSDLERLG